MSEYSVELTGGIDGTAGYGLWLQFDVDGVWATDETWSMTVLLNGLTYVVGLGRVSNLQPTFAMTYRDRIYALVGESLYFSADGTPSLWERQETSAGFIVTSGFNSYQDQLVSLANFQAKLAVFSENNIQLWKVDPTPTEFNQEQLLQNIGTTYSKSVQAAGDMDVYFLAHSGVRSLKVAQETAVSIVTDVGSPIDKTITDVMRSLTDEEKANVCSVMEPGSNRYWLFVKDTIYVLSYYAAAGITAWSTYKPTYAVNGVQTTFTPEKMIVHKNKIFIRSAGRIFTYELGLFDNSPVTLETPWMDYDQPGLNKQSESIDVVAEGTWQISVSSDPVGQGFSRPWNKAGSSTGLGRFVATMNGTHFKLKATQTLAEAARLSEIDLHMKPQDERK